MRLTVNRVRDTRNAAQREINVPVSSVQRRDTLNGTPLNDGVRGSFDIESERVESSLWLLALCCISLGLVVGVGVGRTIGLWR